MFFRIWGSRKVKEFFGIIGGMGTVATENFVHTVNQLTETHKDQDYLDYVVFNHASIPDRTAYIFDHTKPNPLPLLQSDVEKLNDIGVSFIVMTCNTAHYFRSELQKSSKAPILSMPNIAASACQTSTNKDSKVGIMATDGTISAEIYQKELIDKGVQPVVPDEHHQQLVMSLIYDDIKNKDFVNREKYHQLITYFFQTLACDYIILGCTELSVAQEQEPYPSEYIIDAQHELAKYVVKHAE